MINNIYKKMAILLIIFFIGCTLFYAFNRYRDYEKYKDAIQLKASRIIELPKLEGKNITCTGLYYNHTKDIFLVGSIGKEKPTDKEFYPSIVSFDRNFNIVNNLKLKKYSNNMRDIQGVTLNDENNIWFCSPGDNTIKLIDYNGNLIRSIEVKNPTGIVYDKEDKTLWVLTDKKLMNMTQSGAVLKQIKVEEPGQDQLYLDALNHKIYFTAGLDYGSESYVFVYDIKSNVIEAKYVLKDSYAIEGITIVGNKMYILNDGYYHNAKIPVDQVNIYDI